MKIKLIFEDNENTPSSLLLKQCGFGDNIYFSNGSNQLENTIHKMYEVDSMLFVFMDIPPNNQFAVKHYRKIIESMKYDEKYNNVYIIPIICMEYYICKFLYHYGYSRFKDKNIKKMEDAIVKDFNYNEIPKEILNIKKVGTSLEKAYKYIVDNQAFTCMRNSFRYDKDTNQRVKSLRGTFYETDCNHTYCPLQCKDNIDLKAERLYTMLPLFIIDNEQYKEKIKSYRIDINNISIEDIEHNIQMLYDKICNSMKCSPIKIEIQAYCKN